MQAASNDTTPEKSNKTLLSLPNRSARRVKILAETTGRRIIEGPRLIELDMDHACHTRNLQMCEGPRSGAVSSVAVFSVLGVSARIASSRSSYISKIRCRYFAMVSPCGTSQRCEFAGHPSRRPKTRPFQLPARIPFSRQVTGRASRPSISPTTHGRPAPTVRPASSGTCDRQARGDARPGRGRPVMVGPATPTRSATRFACGLAPAKLTRLYPSLPETCIVAVVTTW